MARQYDVDRDNAQYTRNWHMRRNAPTFVEYIMPRFSGKPCVYLELGVWEGMSACWMLKWVLMHPDSRAVLVDPHLMTVKIDGDAMEAVRQRALHNLAPWKDRCQLIRGNSAEVLHRMLGRHGYAGIKPDSVDVAFVDGNHWALAVLDDARLVLQLVKVGGWLLFDDVENDRPKVDHVRQGLDMFLAESGDRVKQVFKHRYMEGYERTK